jgi:hypothetical protein
VVEHRLDQAALPSVEVSFAREEAVAEQALGLLQDLPLLETRMVGDEDVLDMVGVAQQEDVEPAHVERDDVAVLPSEPQEQAVRIDAELSERLEGRDRQVTRR